MSEQGRLERVLQVDSRQLPVHEIFANKFRSFKSGFLFGDVFLH